ncbi:MAG: hypothetical protein IJ567_07020 [Lachnospiraceae bacterium]|nr:hypothetical protein [Lachnospiraceae bacterium]
MRIQSSDRYYESIFLKEGYKQNEENMKKNSVMLQNMDVDIKISDEGRDKLNSEALRKEKEFVEDKLFTTDNTNEVFFEHYSNLVKIASEKLQEIAKERKYDAEDVMRETIDAYENYFHEIMEQHKDGSRSVTYDIAGKSDVTLEEDLQGLNEAFEERVDALGVFIGIEQLNKKFANPDAAWWFERMGVKYSKQRQEPVVYDEERENEYLSNALEIMKKTQEIFLETYNNSGYKKGMASQALMEVMSRYDNFQNYSKKG